MAEEQLQKACAVCDRHQDSYIEIEWPDDSACVCNWLCLIQFGTLRAATQRNDLRTRIEELEAQAEKSAHDIYLLDYYRQGLLD